MLYPVNYITLSNLRQSHTIYFAETPCLYPYENVRHGGCFLFVEAAITIGEARTACPAGSSLAIISDLSLYRLVIDHLWGYGQLHSLRRVNELLHFDACIHLHEIGMI